MRKQEQYMEDVYQYHKDMLEKQDEKMKNPKYIKYLRYKDMMILFIKAVLIIGIIAIVCFIFSCLFKAMGALKRSVTAEIIDQLELNYKGRFTVAATQNEKESYDGEFRIKDSNGIIFTVYKEKSDNTNDYEEYLTKKYVSEYLSKKQISGFVASEEFTEGNKANFFKYTYGKKVNSFFEIDDAVNEMFDLNAYIVKKAEKVLKRGAFRLHATIYLNDFSYDVAYYDKKYADECKYTAKCKYIEYLHDNGYNDDALFEYEDGEYYRPYNIKITVNEKETKAIATYHYDDKKYYFCFVDIADDVPVLERVGKFKNGAINSITYNGNEYLFGAKGYEIEGSKLPYTWNVELLESFFDVDTKIDYDNKVLILNFKNPEQN